MRLGASILGATLSLVMALPFAGCSFHSNQYDFVKTLVLKKEGGGPKKNWNIEWNGLRTPVYAVNGTDSVFFVDEFGVQLVYEDSQITSAKGLLSKENGMEITIDVEALNDRVKLSYRFLGEATAEAHSCTFWRPDAQYGGEEPDVSMWVQSCSFSNLKYQNRRWVNQLGQLVKLEVFLKRDYPPVKIFIL